MGRLDKAGFLSNPLVSRDKKDAILYKLLLSQDDKSRLILLKAFQPIIENVADRFAQVAKVNYPMLPQATANFMNVVDKTSSLLKKYNGDIKVIGLASYVEKQLWLTMCKWYGDSYGFSTKDTLGGERYRKH